MAWVRSVNKNFGAWTSYTPTLSSAGGAVNVGSTGTQTGAYVQIGKTVIARWKIKWGGTGITTGTGAYFIDLPTSAPASTAQVGLTAGNGYAYNATNAYLSPFTIYCDTSTKLALLYNTTINAGYAVLGKDTPYTWAANFYIEGSIQYETT